MITAALRILLIEDDPADVLIMRRRLSRAGLATELTAVTTLDAGLRKLEEEVFDVVVLDLQLPDAGGLGTLKRIRETAHDVPVVALTALDDEEIEHEAMLGGAQDFLVKDRLDHDPVVRAVRRAVERYERRRSEERELNQKDASHQEAMFRSAGEEDDRELDADVERSYRDLIVQYVRSVQSGDPRPGREVRTLVERLFERRLSARDVLRYHLHVVEAIERVLPPRVSERATHNARLALLEVLGTLADFYRAEVFGTHTGTG